jgi:hypothetical protein
MPVRTKEASEKVSNILGRLDKVAGEIQANHEQWGVPFDTAREVVNNLDKVADKIEQAAFGEDSMIKRQAEVLNELKKNAQVIQRDSDEKYMDSFVTDQGVVQADADEPYMSAYSDDQSSAVRGGKDSAGKPLTQNAG